MKPICTSESIQEADIISTPPRRSLRHGLVVALAFAGLFTAAQAASAAISYGDFVGDSVTYLDVEEDLGLYGAPIISGDTLVFTPLSFEAFAIGDDAPARADLVDGSLSFMMEALDGEWIDSLHIAESGAYTLDGVGTENTEVKVGLVMAINILEVDGVAINIDPFSVETDFAAFDLSDGEVFGGAWAGAATFNLGALANQHANITGNVTKVIITIDNILLATSEDDSIAFIDKKALNINTVHLPEPGTLALAALGSTMVLYGRFRRRGA